MRTTVKIDDKFLADAKEYAGIFQTSAVINEALRAFVALEAGRRLAAMGGSDPDATAAPRRRFW